MELHHGKFQLLQIRCEDSVHLPCGQQQTSATTLNYLGTVLSEDGCTHSELGRRIGIAKADVTSLQKLWNHSVVSKRRRLEIYSGLVESRLLYSLTCCCLTVAQQRRLDGFQNRCLRRVLGVKPAFYSRVSNAEVLRQSGHRLASQLLEIKQFHLLGKVLRAPEQNPLRTCCLTPNTVAPATSRYVRRIGRPRKEWIVTTMTGPAKLLPNGPRNSSL